jgi:hypothetical protein
MDRPDVRWDAISHEQIVAWINSGAGAKATEWIESSLESIAAALTETADTVHTAVQRLQAEEWSGTAATVAAQAMQALRDFDEEMSHHSKLSVLATTGQAGNAAWARSSVPPVVDTRATRVPTGGPTDVLANITDLQQIQHDAQGAEDRARQVMREYESMTLERIATLRPLPSAPRMVLVADNGNDVIAMPDLSNPEDSAGTEVDDLRPRRTDSLDNPRVRNDPNESSPTPVDSQHRESQPSLATAIGTAATEPSTSTNSRSPIALSPSDSFPGSVRKLPRSETTPIDRFGADNGLGNGRFQDRGGTGSKFPSGDGGPMTRSVLPSNRERLSFTEPMRRGGTPAVAPLGATGATRSDEDKEHQRRYGIPVSEIYEPDHDDGMILDPYRPGSYVASAPIGDDEEE